MNEHVNAELRIHVERAVRPVRASLARKRRMRDDLMSHLLSIYHDEVARTGNTDQALQEAKRRFGNPGDTSAELQHSVPRWDWIRCLLERAGFEQNESLAHLVGKHLALCCSAYFVAFLLALPMQIARHGMSELLLMAHVLLVMAVVTSLFSSVFTFLADRIGRARYGEEHERSKRTCIRYSAAALFILPLMMLLIYAGLGLALPSPATLGLTVLFAPLMPLLLILISRQAADEISYEEGWAALELDS